MSRSSVTDLRTYAALVTKRHELHLAQVNIALPVAPMDSSTMAEFVANLEPINALADGAPGFVWRLQDESGDATSIQAFDDERLLINMSVWESADALWNFVYSGPHLEVMRRRRQWFSRIAEIFIALWWVQAGTVPTPADARERLEYLAEYGPTPYAFTFKQRFRSPAAGADEITADDRQPCSA